MPVPATSKILLMLLPYPVIIAGLYLFHSVWITMVVYHCTIILSLVIFKETGFPKKLLKGRNFKLALLLTIIAACSGVFIFFLWPLLNNNQMHLGDMLAVYGLYEHQWILFILYYSLITPALEEYFWRELMGSMKKGPDLSDFLFAGYHVPVLFAFIKPVYIILIFLVLVCAARIWRNIKIQQKGLFVPFVSHFIADVSTIFAVYLIFNHVNIRH